jgi:phosphoglycolate phosphatase-like HAD superfamily hydrolase
MDGTLVDAFKPIFVALNTILEEYGFPTMTSLQVRRHTGSGGGSIASLFGDKWPVAHTRFLEIHDSLYLKEIKPLPGSTSLLRWLMEQQTPCGIVTNKSQERAEAQIAHRGW